MLKSIRKVRVMTTPATVKLDKLDLAILNEVQQDSRISNNELARRINLSQPATHTRLKRLKEQGVIRDFVTVLDNEAIGLEIICFFHAQLRAHSEASLVKFEEAVNEFSEVLEFHYLTGEFDYLIKAVFKNRLELEQFLRTKLSTLPDVSRITTSLVLSEIKNTTELPLPIE